MSVCLSVPSPAPALGQRWDTGEAGRALRRGALLGARCGGECAVLRSLLWAAGPAEPRAPDTRTNPAVGTPGRLCWWGGLTMLDPAVCAGSLCDFCARLEPGEVSVPASCGQAGWGSPEQLLCRAREGLMPPSFPRKAPASGVSLPLAAADMAGLLVTSAQPPPGRDLPGLWSSPAVPAVSSCTTPIPGTPAGAPALSQVGRNTQGLPEASSSPGMNLAFPAAGLGGLVAG